MSKGRTVPATGAFAITPADDGAITARALYIGTAGDVKVDTVAGDTAVVFKNAVAGSIIPVEVTRVYDTDTDADNLVGLV